MVSIVIDDRWHFWWLENYTVNNGIRLKNVIPGVLCSISNLSIDTEVSYQDERYVIIDAKVDKEDFPSTEITIRKCS